MSPETTYSSMWYSAPVQAAARKGISPPPLRSHRVMPFEYRQSRATVSRSGITSPEGAWPMFAIASSAGISEGGSSRGRGIGSREV